MIRLPLSLISRHLVNGVITLFLIVTITFFLLRLLPGGPFDQERQLPPDVQANLEARFHLNEPVHVQYVTYLNNVIHGDLGPSYKYISRSVNDIIAEGAAVSFQLGVWAILIGVAVGIGLGLLAGGTRQAWLDSLLATVGMSAISLPSFVFGTVLVMIFAYQLNWLPAARLETPRHALLPIFTLSLVPFAYSFMLIRTGIKSVRSMPFIQMKLAYGLGYWRVMTVHVLKNALIPLVSIMGPLTAALVTGSFAVELIFGVPGLGKHFVYGVSNRDYTLVMGITLVYSVTLILFNLFTEILYGVINPRMQAEG